MSLLTQLVYAFFMLGRQGFTLIEILMVMALIGILATLSLIPLNDSLDQAKFDQTLNQMKQIRSALVGEMLNSNSTKLRFGYLGDLGKLPTTAQGLTALWEQPSGFDPWESDAPSRIGSGWNGPYLMDQGVAGVDYAKDAWSTPYVYDPDSDPVTLISRGADRGVGGTGINADITLTLPLNRLNYTVHGVMLDHGNPWSGSCDVEINYPHPDTGKITSKSYTIQSTDSGAFAFDHIPPGVRSITFFLPSKSSPVVTYGPYIITVDQPHTLVKFGTADHPLDLTSAP